MHLYLILRSGYSKNSSLFLRTSNMTMNVYTYESTGFRHFTRLKANYYTFVLRTRTIYSPLVYDRSWKIKKKYWYVSLYYCPCAQWLVQVSKLLNMLCSQLKGEKKKEDFLGGPGRISSGQSWRIMPPSLGTFLLHTLFFKKLQNHNKQNKTMR